MVFSFTVLLAIVVFSVVLFVIVVFSVVLFTTVVFSVVLFVIVVFSVVLFATTVFYGTVFVIVLSGIVGVSSELEPTYLTYLPFRVTFVILIAECCSVKGN